MKMANLKLKGIMNGLFELDKDLVKFNILKDDTI